MLGASTDRRSALASKGAENSTHNDRPPVQISPIRETLRKYLTDMKTDHVYLAKNVLAAARLDLNRQNTYRRDGTGGRPGIIYDAESPFKNMPSIGITGLDAVKEALKRPDMFKFKVTHYTKPNNQSQSALVVPTVLSKVTPGTPLPRKCRAYTTLRNNILADNEEEMRYLPYFGETAADDVLHQLHLEELYIDKTKESPEEGRIMEYAAMYGIFIDEFLSDVNVSIDAVIQYLIGNISEMRDGACNRRQEALPEDLDLDDPKLRAALQNVQPVNLAELERAEEVCKAFMDMTELSLWEVIKKTSRAVKNSISPAKHTATGASSAPNEREDKEVAVLTGGNPWPYSLDSYSSLNCLICYMHECPFHGGAGKTDTLRRTPAEGDGTDGEIPDGEFKLSSNIPGWSYSSKQATKDAFAEGEFCSTYCFTKKGMVESVIPGEWSQAQISILRASAGVLRNNPRCACLCVAIINKPCAEIYIRLQEEDLMPILPLEDSYGSLEATNIRVLKRKKTPMGFLQGYPPDTDRTHVHEKRADVRPCRHLGPCKSSCECVRAHVTCEKACACPPDCPRKWRGCSCKRERRPCMSDKCICVKANRECDPDLCGACGAYDLLDPVNRYGVVANNDCQNVSLQREISKKTLLGHSTVSGMGLFIGENVKKNEFIGEYKGEIVTNEEAERRGKLYDKRGISFLFTLNAAQAIDATRMGNKFRFINHSQKFPNCGAKVTMANCAQRIGFWATRDLHAGEELFFDYGYNHKQVKFVQKEPPIIPGMPQDKASKKSRSRAHLEYLKGGKGSTERSRKSAEASATSTRVVRTRTRGKGRKQPLSSEFVCDSSPGEDDDSDANDNNDNDNNSNNNNEEEVVVKMSSEMSEYAGEEDEEDEETDVVEEEPPSKRGRWSGGGPFFLAGRATRRFGAPASY